MFNANQCLTSDIVFELINIYILSRFLFYRTLSVSSSRLYTWTWLGKWVSKYSIQWLQWSSPLHSCVLWLCSIIIILSIRRRNYRQSLDHLSPCVQYNIECGDGILNHDPQPVQRRVHLFSDIRSGDIRTESLIQIQGTYIQTQQHKRTLIRLPVSGVGK